MATLNKNNFLIWEGSFNDAPFSNVATDDSASMLITAAFVELQPLLNDISTYGINVLSFEFTLQDNLITLATWDSVTQKIKYFPPAGISPGVRLLKYRWRDNFGNLSNEATVSIDVQPRATAWRGDPSSYVCDNPGVTNGAGWGTLEKYYTDNNDLFLPHTTKPNDPVDPDFIAPVNDPIMCPLSSSTDNLNIFNFVSGSPEPTIIRITLNKSGGGTTVLNVLHRASNAQPRIVPIAPGLYTTIDVLVNDATGADLTLNPGSGGSGGGTQSIATASETKSFAAVTIGTNSELILTS
jgi:hypothetical protein